MESVAPTHRHPHQNDGCEVECTHERIDVRHEALDLVVGCPAALAMPPLVQGQHMEAASQERASGSQLRALPVKPCNREHRGPSTAALQRLNRALRTTRRRLPCDAGARATWADVDVEKRKLQVRQQVQRTRGGWTFSEPKTASGRRLVVLPRMAAEAVKEHRRRQVEARLRRGPEFEDLDLVFPNALGRPLERQNLMRRSFKPLLAKAGLPDIPFHGLRHSTATPLLGEGVHPRIVQERLGHASSAITQDLYSHVAPSLQAEAADKIDRLFAAN